MADPRATPGGAAARGVQSGAHGVLGPLHVHGVVEDGEGPSDQVRPVPRFRHRSLAGVAGPHVLRRAGIEGLAVAHLQDGRLVEMGHADLPAASTALAKRRSARERSVPMDAAATPTVAAISL